MDRWHESNERHFRPHHGDTAGHHELWRDYCQMAERQQPNLLPPAQHQSRRATTLLQHPQQHHRPQRHNQRYRYQPSLRRGNLLPSRDSVGPPNMNPFTRFVSVLYFVPLVAGAASSTPCMDMLSKFMAPDVPALAPSEAEVRPRKAYTNSAPADLPGKGLAQHPMVYVGEGYNKMFLVNGGKVIWTYQTGTGNEYDDVWMLSNGNILFSRMQYVAIITPDKKVVWRYDARNSTNLAEHTEIHGCQPIGLDKVLFVENGLPPKLKVANLKTGRIEA